VSRRIILERRDFFYRCQGTPAAFHVDEMITTIVPPLVLFWLAASSRSGMSWLHCAVCANCMTVHYEAAIADPTFSEAPVVNSQLCCLDFG
jgi:hypothetical protein